MILRKHCHPGTSLTDITYSFLKPARLLIRNQDGTEVLTGYGIGEHITVLEPSVQLLICSNEQLEQIPLADGRMIVKYPADISVVQVYK